jgi:hypothetical protein
MLYVLDVNLFFFDSAGFLREPPKASSEVVTTRGCISAFTAKVLSPLSDQGDNSALTIQGKSQRCVR